MNTMDTLGAVGLVPVVVIDKASNAVPTARALIRGGVPVMEVTMRTPAALAAIRALRESGEKVIVGAGTVLTPEQCVSAVDAGAEFIVSPGFDPDVVDICIERGVPVTPGCVTPTEIQAALKKGVRTLKFFPASVYGGVKACAALYGPFKSAGVKFIPTGGVDLKNLAEYADKEYIHAIGGGWLCSTKALASGDFGAIEDTARRSVSVLLGLEVAECADEVAALTGFSVAHREGERGECISVCANSLIRTAWHLEHAGVGFTCEYAGGTPVSITLSEKINSRPVVITGK